jgi:site-specific recombinase XerD
MAGCRSTVALPDAGRELILDHLAWRLDQGYKPRSTARFLSGVRGFFRYLLREKLIAVDPTLQVDMPQLGAAAQVAVGSRRRSAAAGAGPGRSHRPA